MGAWGTGVFDNDDALDFVTELTDVDPGQRETYIVQALRAAADAEAYLEVDDGQAAIVAAAAMAAARTGQPLTNSGTGLAATELPAATPELLALAVRALDRVTGKDSEWRELWGEGDTLDAALTALAEVRTNLV